MTVPTGPASLADIQTEFGGVNPIGLNEYYAGGAYVLNPPPTSAYQTGAIPTSGAISIGDFLGVKHAFTFNDVVSANLLSGYNMYTRAVAAGWDGISPIIATITVNTGVYVSGSPAFQLGITPPVGSSVFLTNHGTIGGLGGAGGAGGSASNGSGGAVPTTYTSGQVGGNGSTALNLTYSISIGNYGVIGGGGGGGGGGAPGWYTNSIGGGKSIPGTPATVGIAGGGGGGGQIDGTAGSVGTATGNDGGNAAGTSGSAGTLTGVGAGGGNAASGLASSGTGGAGGLLGQPGQDGTQNGSGYAAPATFGTGGSTGAAWLNGGYVTWYSYGSVTGLINSWGSYAGSGSSNVSFMAASNPAIAITRNASWTTALGSTWYWKTKTGSTANQPSGNTTFQMLYENTSGVTQTCHLHGAIDNTFVSMQINGVPTTVGGTFVANAYTSTYVTNNFLMTPGVNVITVVLNNSAVSVAGFFLELINNATSGVVSPASNWFF